MLQQYTNNVIITPVSPTPVIPTSASPMPTNTMPIKPSPTETSPTASTHRGAALFAGRRWSLCLLLCVAAAGITATASLGWAEDEPLSIAAVPSRPTGAEPAADGTTNQEVARNEAQLSKRYRRLEEMFLRLAELTGATDPGQADLLRKAMVESKRRLIAVQFEQIVERLQRDRLGDAIAAQKRLREDLQALLELLLSDVRADRLDEEQQQVAAWLKELNELISRQQSLRGRTERAGDSQQLAGDQQQLADRTKDLREDMAEKSRQESEAQDGSPLGDDGNEDTPPIEKDANAQSEQQESGDTESSDPSENDTADTEGSESQPSESEPSESDSSKSDSSKSDGTESDAAEPSDNATPGESSESGESQDSSEASDSGESSESGKSGEAGESGESSPSQQRLSEARRRMRQAREQLERSQRRDAVKEQNEALRQLEQAKAELEETLRQLREEEIAQMLAMLEAQFHRMIQEQAEIYEATVLLDEKSADQPSARDQVQAVRLSERESQLAAAATAVLQTLRDDGSATALPEAVQQVRDDMLQVAELISRYDTGNFTQSVERDIITSLEELLAAVKKAQDDQEQRQQDSQESQSGGQQGEPPLVDQLAELRMIRAMQLRINRRTLRLDQRAAGPNTPPNAIDAALEELSEREQRIIRATRSIAEGAKQ
jgi:hypothetical protein